ncbi:MAG: TolC family protein [Bryobacterales bacterium]|nr:TolC family protein [Bryobacterales bacterium]
MRPAVLLLVSTALLAQAPKRLTLKEAESIAIRNHPQVSAAQFNARAANETTAAVHAALLPTLFGSVSAVAAADNTRIAAGGLNNPAIFNRFATGFTINQLISDFGRTARLTDSSRLRARALEETVESVRADVLVQVDRAYFTALRAQAVLRVAEETVGNRQLIADRVSALAESKLRSGLDLSFAKVNLSEAKLLLIGAKNEIRGSFAELAAVMGARDMQSYELADEPLPDELPREPEPFVSEALRNRPELASLRAESESALKFAEAERNLRLPTLGAIASAGVIPVHDERLRGRYAAVGVSLNIPVFNGYLNAARRSEADLRAQAARQRVRDAENRIARDVQLAWLNANTAFERLAVTGELLEQAALALDLAQSRYDLGLSSMVELSQAQLSKTGAEIASSSARYEYQIRRAMLRYAIGALK